MKTRIARAMTLALAVSAAPALAQTSFGLDQAAAGGRLWKVPTCRTVHGPGNVTYTTDEGATLVPTSRALSGTTYTLGLAVLDTANTLLAVKDRALYRSTSAGCRWTAVDVISSPSDGFPLYLAAAPGGLAYAWADGRNDLVRIDDSGRTIVYLRSPVSGIAGLEADALDGSRVRLGADDGSIWESLDGGTSWSQVGSSPAPGTFAYRVAFDPGDLDHVLVGTMSNGAFVSTNGGAAWTPAAGLSSASGPFNVFNLVVAPSNPQVVYAMGINLDEADQGAPSEGKHIYRSLDGGSSFAPVVDKSGAVTIVNGPLMAVHPVNADVLYFVFGTSFQNYGTDIYRYDGASGLVTSTHNAYDRVGAIDFNPADPGVMYLGLANEQTGP